MNGKGYLKRVEENWGIEPIENEELPSNVKFIPLDPSVKTYHLTEGSLVNFTTRGMNMDEIRERGGGFLHNFCYFALLSDVTNDAKSITSMHELRNNIINSLAEVNRNFENLKNSENLTLVNSVFDVLIKEIEEIHIPKNNQEIIDAIRTGNSYEQNDLIADVHFRKNYIQFKYED